MTGPDLRSLLAPLRDVACDRQIALRAGAQEISYAELRSAVAARTEQLRRLGVRPGDRVAIHLPKSIGAVTTILATLAAGAAYAPLNPQLPWAAFEATLGDLAPHLLVCDAEIAAASLASPRMPGGMMVAAMDGADWRAPLVEAGRSAGGRALTDEDEDDLAVLFYTSGTTGEPKGIMLTHANVAAFVNWAARTFELGPEDEVASHAPFSFDLSIFDLFATLARHGTVHLLDETAVRFPGAVRAFIEAAGITVWYSVPTALVRLEERKALVGLRSLRLVLFAGEVFPVPSLRRLMTDVPGPRYVNLYGPTETNVCTYHPLAAVPEEGEAVPIGRACEHLAVTIRSPAGDVLPDGECGEICVEGPAVMRGYWRRPEMTRAARLGRRPDSYRTGDEGRRRPDGVFEFVGRRDRQVKLRGHRVELLALEAVLADHPDIREAAALALPDDRMGGRLVAFVVARGEASHAGIRQFVAARLAPAYVPDHIEVLSELPRTPNGKCDHAALASYLRTSARA